MTHVHSFVVRYFQKIYDAHYKYHLMKDLKFDCKLLLNASTSRQVTAAEILTFGFSETLPGMAYCGVVKNNNIYFI